MDNLISPKARGQAQHKCPALFGVRQKRQDVHCAAFNEWALQQMAAVPSDVPVIIANRSSAYLHGNPHGTHDLAPNAFLIGPCAIWTRATANFFKNTPITWSPTPAALSIIAKGPTQAYPVTTTTTTCPKLATAGWCRCLPTLWSMHCLAVQQVKKMGIKRSHSSYSICASSHQKYSHPPL